jgi:hypothetical protein
MFKQTLQKPMPQNQEVSSPILAHFTFIINIVHFTEEKKELVNTITKDIEELSRSVSKLKHVLDSLSIKTKSTSYFS